MKLIATTILSCAVVFGQSAFAEEHEVWIEDGTFFPSTIHVVAGDTIRYINKTDLNIAVVTDDDDDNVDGYDSSNPCIDSELYEGSTDDWVTETLGAGDEVVVNVTSCMETSVAADGAGYYQWQWVGSYYYGYWDQVFVDAPYDGDISFDAPDLGL